MPWELRLRATSPRIASADYRLRKLMSGDLIELLLVVAERNGRQHEDFAAGVVSDLRRLLGQGRRLDDVCSVRKVQIVCLSRAPWKGPLRWAGIREVL